MLTLYVAPLAALYRASGPIGVNFGVMGMKEAWCRIDTRLPKEVGRVGIEPTTL
jgi:hypothetical protein